MNMDALLEHFEKVNWIGLVLMCISIALVYGALPLAKLFIKQEEKQKKLELVFKFSGLAMAVIALLILIKLF